MRGAAAPSGPLPRAWAASLAALGLALILVLVVGGSPGSARAPAALTLSLRAPQRADVAIARVDLPAPARRPGRHVQRTAPLRLGLKTGSGFEYVALLTLPSRGQTRSLLVLTANRRPAGSLAPDPTQVALILEGADRVRPIVSQTVNPISTRRRGSIPAPAPNLCGLRPATVLAAGAALVVGSPFGYTPQAAAGQGLDAACGRTMDPAFTAALAVG